MKRGCVNIVGRKMGHIKDCDNLWKPSIFMISILQPSQHLKMIDLDGYIYLSYRTPDVLADLCSLGKWRKMKGITSTTFSVADVVATALSSELVNRGNLRKGWHVSCPNCRSETGVGKQLWRLGGPDPVSSRTCCFVTACMSPNGPNGSEMWFW